MSYELFISGEYATTLDAKRENIKAYMIETNTAYVYAVRTDGKCYHCHLRNGRLSMKE